MNYELVESRDLGEFSHDQVWALTLAYVAHGTASGANAALVNAYKRAVAELAALKDAMEQSTTVECHTGKGQDVFHPFKGNMPTKSVIVAEGSPLDGPVRVRVEVRL